MRDVMTRFTFDKKKFELLDENEYTSNLLKENLPVLIVIVSDKDEACYC